MILWDGHYIDWVHIIWHGLGAQLGTRAKPGNHLVLYTFHHNKLF